MFIKQLSLLSLLFSIGFVFSNPILRKLNEKENALKEARKTEKIVTEKLNANPQGQLYREKLHEWHNCTDKNDHNACEEFYHALELALIDVKETEEYQHEYKPVRYNVEHLEWTISGLKIINNSRGYYGFSLDTMQAAVDSINIPIDSNESLAFLEWAENSRPLQTDVKNKLNDLIDNIRICRKSWNIWKYFQSIKKINQF
ncbi:MAG TPA: hypothetical protein VLB80_03320 [Candidatus Babeliales bacterium]|nr:hypothetical protein [Candidatus Babeliales bacterium]